MAFKVGDKAKVIDKESLLYNKTVELIEVNDEAYIFNYGNTKLKLMVHKDAIQKTIEWESSPDRGETNLDKLTGQNRELVEKRQKQVLACALKIVQGYCEETPNKMEVVAALFGKKFGERFTVERDNDRFDCEFSCCGLMTHGAYENPYTDFDCFILADLLTGRAVSKC